MLTLLVKVLKVTENMKDNLVDFNFKIDTVCDILLTTANWDIAFFGLFNIGFGHIIFGTCQAC